MLLWLIVMIGISSAILELMLVVKVPALRRLVTKYVIVGLIFSIILSIVLSSIFAVGGLVAFGAFVTSTVITGAIYGAVNIWERSKQNASKADAKLAVFRGQAGVINTAASPVST